MVKSLHSALKVLLLIACLSAPVAMIAQDTQHSAEMGQAEIVVTVSRSNLRVQNAGGLVLQIFSITGENLYSQRIEGMKKEINLDHLPRGYYIVQIGNGKYTRKIYLS